MKTNPFISENKAKLNHSTTSQTQQPRRAPFTPVLAPRPCRTHFREQLRNIRSAELAFWEATGGDVLNAGAARLFAMSVAGTSPRASRW